MRGFVIVNSTLFFFEIFTCSLEHFISKPNSFLVKCTQLCSYEKYLVDIPHTKVIDAKYYSK